MLVLCFYKFRLLSNFDLPGQLYGCPNGGMVCCVVDVRVGRWGVGALPSFSFLPSASASSPSSLPYPLAHLPPSAVQQGAGAGRPSTRLRRTVRPSLYGCGYYYCVVCTENERWLLLELKVCNICVVSNCLWVMSRC